MLTVLFFGRVREQLGCERLEQAWSDNCSDVQALQTQLCTERGENWREILGQDNMICAVNQAVVEGNHPLSDGDEVAFFPPVTGG